MFDLDAYVERVHLSGRSGLTEVHRAQVTSIPFENLDPHCGLQVSLELEDLQRKLVGQPRGGYCFEQNLLLKAALEALGAHVEPMLARVKFGAPPGVVRPRTHLVLRVEVDGQSWLADAGFGLGTLPEPLPFGPGVAHELSGWRFRIVEDRFEHVLQAESGSEWVDLYGFMPQPVPMSDIEVANWYTSAHPSSPFVTGLIVSTQRPDGTRIALSDRGQLALTEQTPAGAHVTPISRDEIPQLLDTRFGLPGFTLDRDGRLTQAGQS
ncbi:MAG TPA: arylamine N-acetyltransferase [Solirubrobacteraceae bacterium]|nr:arylamine N-acetyltransferase [Solirubrobacteraceae bacterium]